ncbi:DUF6970 domain-containing protein [Fibrella arboris]|uniref:DUF6970 domain-containing protein n=1 Tax=Fibrella arboris TaxID=3242486 RepID=UPI003522F0AF
MQKEPVRNPRGNVTQYSYKERIVYYVLFNSLLDASCSSICAPDGVFLVVEIAGVPISPNQLQPRDLSGRMTENNRCVNRFMTTPTLLF